ncbi:MAG: peptidoglycan bridge formation glycyltransferase FemA/FemB family protein, partial [Bacteroidales bacterium]|nr:peptidoglycan bridge formation glycyltransferase FemA/FemB family protein [Bacteroidales bacterium]
RKAIYVESRNFNDYGRWRMTFEKFGFEYEQHLNFHVDCTDWETVETNIGKHRRRYIRQSLKNGATIVNNPTEGQIEKYYSILLDLYRTKVKMPLYPFEFFNNLYKLHSCRFILIEFNNEIIGGSVCMCLSGKAVYEWFACGMDGVYKGVHPSSLTKYAGMRFAHENNFAVFDMMGAGKPDEDYGVRDFKAEFGGKLVEHGRFRYVCNPFLFKLGTFGVKILKKL